jgi:DNA-directed RNA polymerase subunit K/omega
LSARVTTAHPLVRVGTGTHGLSNRFLLSAVAFLRSKQLEAGATARVARDGHKPTYIAVLEVLGDTVSWSRDE